MNFSFRLDKFQLLAGRNGGDGMFINQVIILSSEHQAEIVEADNDPFYLSTGGQFNGHMASISTDSIKKLILDINLILHHSHLPR